MTILSILEFPDPRLRTKASPVKAVNAQIQQLAAARQELATLAERARRLDPSACTDPNRCQVIAEARSGT